MVSEQLVFSSSQHVWGSPVAAPYHNGHRRQIDYPWLTAATSRNLGGPNSRESRSDSKASGTVKEAYGISRIWHSRIPSSTCGSVTIGTEPAALHTRNPCRIVVAWRWGIGLDIELAATLTSKIHSHTKGSISSNGISFFSRKCLDGPTWPLP